VISFWANMQLEPNSSGGLRVYFDTPFLSNHKGLPMGHLVKDSVAILAGNRVKVTIKDEGPPMCPLGFLYRALTGDDVVPLFIEHSGSREIVETAMGCLTERDRYVLTRRFGLDGEMCDSLSGIGSKFNLSSQRIRQIEHKALRKLRHPSRLGAWRAFLGRMQDML
jgi:hypothetical protein